jgi:hypothetical protein
MLFRSSGRPQGYDAMIDRAARTPYLVALEQLYASIAAHAV